MENNIIIQKLKALSELRHQYKFQVINDGRVDKIKSLKNLVDEGEKELAEICKIKDESDRDNNFIGSLNLND